MKNIPLKKKPIYLRRLAFLLPFAAFLLFVTFTARAQLIINTIAGTGTGAYGGDGGPATVANINTPYGVAVDPIGNVYFTDYYNNRIRKIDTFGIITTIAGNGTPGFSGDGGPATIAEIHAPRGITVDDTGNVYFSDYANYRIRKINTFGFISTVAGDGFATFIGDGGPAVFASINLAWGLAIDTSGNLFIADQGNCRIRKVNPAGIISSIGGTGIAFFSGDGGPATAAGIQYPMGVALDAAGDVFIADDGDCRIRKINTSGIISTVAGNGFGGFTGDGGPATSAKLYYPQGIALDAEGNIYIADLGNNRIREVKLSTGVINTIVGTGPAAFGGDGGPPALAEINQMTGVAIGTTGNIYIADNDNNRIRMVHNNNHTVYFTGGHIQYLTFCATEAVNIDTLLSAADVDSGKTATWSLISGPIHGTALASYATVSPGYDTLIPSGLNYEMGPGSTGTDTFSVRITDGTLSDTTTIYVTIQNAPVAGVITGVDSICPGDTFTFTDTAAGGAWSISNTAISAIAATGLVTGLTPGTATILYTVTNLCGTTAAYFPLIVRDYCPTGVNLTGPAPEGIDISPNPNYGNFSADLKTNQQEEVHFIITDMPGKIIKEITATSGHPVSIRLDEPPGIYFLSAITAHGKWVNKLVITK